MFYLYARIHFHKIEIFIAIYDKFNRFFRTNGIEYLLSQEVFDRLIAESPADRSGNIERLRITWEEIIANALLHALSGNGPHRSDRRPIHLDARRTDRPFEDHRPDSDQEPGHHLRDHALVVSIPVLQRSQLSFLLQLPHELLQKEHSGHEQPDRSVLHHYRQRIGQDGPGLLQ